MPDILSSAAGQLLGAGLGILTAGFNDRRQLEQQKKLMEMQSEYDEIASQRNLNNQLKLWDATNYPSQVAQMQKAGLSVGLMYKGGGQSGQIAADNVNRQAPTAANGGGMEIQQMMQIEAQNRLANAETAKTLAEANKIAGVDTKGQDLDNKWQEIENRIQLSRENIAAANITEASANAQKEVELWNQEMLNTKYLSETQEERVVKLVSEIALLQKEGAKCITLFFEVIDVRFIIFLFALKI